MYSLKEDSEEENLDEIDTEDDVELEEDVEEPGGLSGHMAHKRLMTVEILRFESNCGRTDIGVDGSPFIMENEIHPFARTEGKIFLGSRPYRYT